MFYKDFSAYLLLLSSAIGFSLVAILMIRRRPLSYYFFSAQLLIMSLSALNLGLIKSKWLLDLPHFYLSASPLQFLLGPACYFFVRLSFEPGYRFRFIDLMHLLPFLLHTVELVPFFLLSGEEKTEIILRNYELSDFSTVVVNHQRISFYLHLFLKSSSIFIYATVSFLFIRQRFRPAMQSFKALNIVIYRWVNLEVTLKIIISLTGMARAAFNQSLVLDMTLALAMVADSIIGYGFILLNPKILQGTRPVQFTFLPVFNIPAETSTDSKQSVTQRTEADTENKEVDTGSSTTSEEQDLVIFHQIEAYFQTSKPFLNGDFSREILGKHLKSANKNITRCIKTGSGLSFPDYVNSYRLRHLEEIAPINPELKKYTIDAIAAEIGFSNRITFYNACKRHKDQTPSAYLTSLGLGEKS